MENTNRLGFPLNPLDLYPKTLAALDDAGDYIRNLKEDKILIINRAQNEEENTRIQLAILYFLLFDRSKTQFDFKDLVVISRDGLKQCSSHIYNIISENWMRISTDVKSNVLYILIDFLQFPMAESLFIALFKRMASGDLSQANLWLIENMLNLIEENKELMLKDSKLLPLIVYTYLRLIPTQYQMSIAINAPNTSLARLCKKEIALVIDIIRNNFDDVFRHGGKDMMFMLQQVSNIPEFKTLFSEMCHNIGSLSTNFTNVTEIFSISTSKAILSTAIPFDMETWILWMMRYVHHTNTAPYKRYQDLFSKRFFSTPESQNLRPYLIRFITRVFYPDNEMIASTLISRWATISWLLIQATTPTVIANCKMALIFDWLFYDTRCDHIMDIEPAILAIMHNITKYPHVSVTLIDFVVKTSNLYHPTLRDKIIACVRFGLSEALRMNVFRSLGPLFDILRHNGDLLRQFAELIGDTSISLAPVATTTAPPVPPTKTPDNVPAPVVSETKEKIVAPKTVPLPPNKPLDVVNKHVNIKAPSIMAVIGSLESPKPIIETVMTESIQKEDISFDELKRRFMKYSLAFDYNVERIDVTSVIAQINSPIIPALESLHEAAEQCHSLLFKSKSKRDKKSSPKKLIKRENEQSGASDDEHLQDMYEKMEQVVIAILNDDRFDDLGTAGNTAAVLCEICYPYFDKKLFSDYSNEEKLKLSLSLPVFVIFKNICAMSTQDTKRELLLLLLAEMQMRQPRVGYYLLYYLKIAKVVDPDLSIYRSLCNSLEKPNLKNSLYKDLDLLSNDDSRLMVFLLPDLYLAFSTEMVGNPQFAYLIVSRIDATEMNLLGIEIQKKNLTMFSSSSVVDILRGSLELGTIEQYFLWELLLSHNIPAKYFYGLIPYLDCRKHPEALLRFSNFLRQDKPNHELIRALLNREVEKGDHFTATLLHFWSSDNNTTGSKFVSILHTILAASLGNNNKDKKKNRHGQGNDDWSVDLDKILGHLDFMRVNCKDISFLQTPSIQGDLKQVLTTRSLTDDLKVRFSELLAIVDDEEVDDDSDGDCTVSEKTVSGSGRVLRNHESRRYAGDNNNHGRTTNKRRLFTNSDSSSSSDNDDNEDDDDDDESDDDMEASNGRKSHFHKRGKKRLVIGD